MTKFLTSLLFSCTLALALSGCSAEQIPFVYKIDIPQGNLVKDEQIEKLKIGMTPEQVNFLLGTPLLVDPFHQNQWDYVYNFTPGTKKRREGVESEEQLLRVFFTDGMVSDFKLMEREE